MPALAQRLEQSRRYRSSSLTSNRMQKRAPDEKATESSSLAIATDSAEPNLNPIVQTHRHRALQLASRRKKKADHPSVKNIIGNQKDNNPVNRSAGHEIVARAGGEERERKARALDVDIPSPLSQKAGLGFNRGKNSETVTVGPLDPVKNFRDKSEWTSRSIVAAKKDVSDESTSISLETEKQVFGATIETPRAVSVASLRASFNARASDQPIMPMTSNNTSVQYGIISHRKRLHARPTMAIESLEERRDPLPTLASPRIGCSRSENASSTTERTPMVDSANESSPSSQVMDDTRNNDERCPPEESRDSSPQRTLIKNADIELLTNVGGLSAGSCDIVPNKGSSGFSNSSSDECSCTNADNAAVANTKAKPGQSLSEEACLEELMAPEKCTSDCEKLSLLDSSSRKIAVDDFSLAVDFEAIMNFSTACNDVDSLSNERSHLSDSTGAETDNVTNDSSPSPHFSNANFASESVKSHGHRLVANDSDSTTIYLENDTTKEDDDSVQEESIRCGKDDTSALFTQNMDRNAEPSASWQSMQENIFADNTVVPEERWPTPMLDDVLPSSTHDFTPVRPCSTSLVEGCERPGGQPQSISAEHVLRQTHIAGNTIDNAVHSAPFDPFADDEASPVMFGQDDFFPPAEDFSPVNWFATSAAEGFQF